MRPVLFLALAFLVASFPSAGADTEQGATVGANLGFMAPGAWDAWWYAHPGGGAAVSLAWEESLFPGADYDLHLYAPSALDDGYLAQAELIAKSNARTFAQHTEGIALTLGAATYVVAVVPFQTQAETYTLTTAGGDLQFAAVAVGYVAYE